MELLLQQILAGVATGGIYACVALAIVMIYQAIDHLNFAQGEMAMFSTFIAWQLMQWGVPYWVAFFATIAVSFGAAVAIERVVLRPLHNAPVLSHVVAFIALFAILNSLAGFIWDFTVKPFPTPFGTHALPGIGLLVGAQSLCLYAAVARLPVALALLAFNTYPLWTALWARLAYRHRAEPRVLRAMSTPLVGHLDPSFVALMEEVKDLLRQTFRTWLPLDVLNQFGEVASSVFRATAVRNVECADEVLIAVGRMQLESMHVVADRGFDSRLRLEVASRTHLTQCCRSDDPLSQLLGPESLASTRRAIEDDLLLVLDDLQRRAFRCALAVVVPSLDQG
mgnify:CR=1 FL=1